MDKNAIQHLDTAIPQSRFHFGSFIGRGFDIWKKQAGLYIVFGILFMVISMVVGLIPIIGSIANQLIIAPLLTAGAYIFSHKVDKNDNPKFENFFDATNHAATIIGIYAIYLLCIMLIMVPIGFGMGINVDMLMGDQDAILDFFTDFNPLVLLSFIPMLFIVLIFTFSTQFAVFYDLSAIDSIKYSAQVFFKHPFMLFFYVIVVGLCAMSGIVGLLICVIVTYSFIFPMMYAAFRYLTQLDVYESEEEDQIVYNTLIE